MKGDLATCTRFRARAVRTRSGHLHPSERPRNLLYHASVLVGRRVFLFGGEQNVKVYVLDMPSRKWSVVPIPRRNKLYLSSHSAFLVGDKVFLTNGHQPTMRQKPRAAVYIYFDLILGEYGKFEVEGPDLQLYGALAGAYVEDLDEIVVYGGSESGRATANIRAFNVAQRKWRAPVVKGGGAPQREYHSSCLHRKNHIYFFGGRGLSHHCQASIFLLQCGPKWFQWSKVFWDPWPEARIAFTMSCVGDRIFIFGGEDQQGSTNDLYMFDLAEKEGCQLVSRFRKAANQFKGDLINTHGHTAVVMGGEIIIMGGNIRTDKAVYVISGMP